jgi:hypothetical protein
MWISAGIAMFGDPEMENFPRGDRDGEWGRYFTPRPAETPNINKCIFKYFIKKFTIFSDNICIPKMEDIFEFLEDI